RVKALDAKALANTGRNVSTEKKVAKATQITKGSNTFGLIALEWLAHNNESPRVSWRPVGLS
ncbi:MAG: hypothetical protein ACK423_07555, partial [Burkholderiales bacterium]